MQKFLLAVKRQTLCKVLTVLLLLVCAQVGHVWFWQRGYLRMCHAVKSGVWVKFLPSQKSENVKYWMAAPFVVFAKCSRAKNTNHQKIMKLWLYRFSWIFTIFLRFVFGFTSSFKFWILHPKKNCFHKNSKTVKFGVHSVGGGGLSRGATTHPHPASQFFFHLHVVLAPPPSGEILDSRLVFILMSAAVADLGGAPGARPHLLRTKIPLIL